MAKWGEGDPRWIVEERPDATNVNNWHWSEKNACQWSQTKLKELFKDIKVENSEGSCLVSEVSKCEGEAVVNNRKGRLIFFYEWSIELKWKATSKKEDPKPLKANGKVTIPNMSEENDVKEVEVTATVEESTDFGYNMKTLMNKEGAKLIREKLSEYIQALKDEYSQGLILPSKDASSEKKPAAVTNSVAPVKLSSQSQLTGAVQNLKLDTVSFSTRETLFCPVDEAYKCFTDEKMVAAYTRGPVVLDPKPGGKFELFQGNISGTFLELEENKRLKQQWRNKSWKGDHRSIVVLTFEQTNDGTVVSLNQSGIPASELEATKEGWNNYYWRSIKQTFGFGSFLTDVL